MSAPPLPGFLSGFAPLIGHYGYVAIGGLVMLEDFGVPVPGETILIAGAVYAGAGRLSVVGVGLTAFVAAVIGDNIGYLIGRLGGRALVARYGRYVLLTAERMDRAESFFRRNGGGIVVIARFIEGLRQLNGIVAGTVEMPWPRFLLFNTIGAALWAGVWTSVGYLAGSHIEVIYSTVVRYSWYVLIGLGVVVAALIARALLRRRRRARAAQGRRDRPVGSDSDREHGSA